MRLLGFLGVTAALLVGLADRLHAEPPPRDPVRLVGASELIVVARVVEVHRIATPHEGYGLDEVEVAEVEILETWKGDANRKRAFYLASPRWTCDVSRAVVGETGAFFLRPFVAEEDVWHEHALETEAFAKGVKKIVGDDELFLLVLSGAGRMPYRKVAETTYATVSLAYAHELLPYLWSTWGPDPRYSFHRLVEVAVLRGLVEELARLPEGEDFRKLFSPEGQRRHDAFDRLLATPDREALVAIALSAVDPFYDDELIWRAGKRFQTMAAEAWASLADLGAHPALLVRIGASRLLACGDTGVPLSRLLDGADVAARRVLARVFVWRGRHGHDESGDDAVLETLLTDEDTEVRRLAVTALLLLADAWEAENLPLLHRASKDPDTRVRRIALRGLGEMCWGVSGEEAARKALDALRRGLEDEDLSVRRASSAGCLSLLRNLKEFLPDPLEEEAALVVFLARAASDVREATRTRDPIVRGTALAALGGYAGADGIATMRDALADELPWIRRCAALGLGWVQADAAVDALALALKDEDENTQVIAVESLVRIGTSAAAAHVLSTMKSAKGFVRWMAAEGLGEIGGEGAAAALLEAVLEGETEVQWRAAVALRDLGIENAPALVRAVREADTYGAGRATFALRCFLWDDDAAVRIAAVRALGEAGADDPETIRALEKLHEDSSTEVREGAAKALEKLRPN